MSIETPAGLDGRGEVRRLTTGRITVREEIVEREEPSRLIYVLLGGLPLRDYRAQITLTPTAAGATEIHWHTTFAPKIPGTGRLFQRSLDKLTTRFVDGLADAAAAG